ncbi:hypothetical protein [Formosa algae]|uniref:Uncharacterized protein n=1 Tax=Formosa algae TaxID=225843 RepID=A0A9X0YNR1_9FLAO|nr:hypothetical protein [Formosa algae]MBP1840779.1 hypothetical protein [Formosa algae]MDQ0336324.1 hypothetical protein [Formosa algae]
MSVDKNTKAEMISDSSDNKYKVFKIDSIEGIYMIYALKSGKYHKIISQNSDSINSNWKPILPNVIYEFELDTLISQIGVYEHMSGLVWTYDGPTIDFEGDSIRDLYTSPNIKGLYYNPKIE